MSGTRLRGGGLVLTSLAVHAVVIVGVWLLAVRAPVAPLFVDLTQDGLAAPEAGASGSVATSSRPVPAGGGASARRGAAASSAPVAPTRGASPTRHVTDRLDDPRVSPSPALAAPVSSGPGATDPIAPAPAVETPVPSDERPAATVPPPGVVAPASADSTGEARFSASGAPRVGTRSAPGADRAAGAASEVGGAGEGPGVSASGGKRLVMAPPGDGRGGVPAEYAPYLARFRRSVEDALVYPLAARRQGLAGRVELDVLLEPGGRVAAVEVHSSSSHGVLDEAGIAAVRSLPPLPFPEGLPRRPLRIRLPLDFQLR